MLLTAIRKEYDRDSLLEGAMLNDETVIAAFSEDHVERLTGLSKTQLRYWDRTEFYTPSLADENRRVAFSRIYSFKDIVALRTLSVLRNQHSVSLQHLRQVGHKLKHLEDRLWTAITLYVLKKRVNFFNPETDRIEDVLSGQYALGIPLETIVADTKRDVEKLQTRDEDQIGKIQRARYVSHNAWVVAGTRIPVAAIKRFVEDGFSVEQIMQEYPTLTKADIEAAIQYQGDGVAA